MRQFLFFSDSFYFLKLEAPQQPNRHHQIYTITTERDQTRYRCLPDAPHKPKPPQEHPAKPSKLIPSPQASFNGLIRAVLPPRTLSNPFFYFAFLSFFSPSFSHAPAPGPRRERLKGLDRVGGVGGSTSGVTGCVCGDGISRVCQGGVAGHGGAGWVGSFAGGGGILR